jgi:gamma-glutamylcysteine synthetase
MRENSYITREECNFESPSISSSTFINFIYYNPTTDNRKRSEALNTEKNYPQMKNFLKKRVYRVDFDLMINNCNSQINSDESK